MKVFMQEERLSDNTKIHYCNQCKDCIYWGDESPFTNKYDKTSCYRFPYPSFKPLDIINNTGECPFREVKPNG